jgi:hypothetical protein
MEHGGMSISLKPGAEAPAVQVHFDERFTAGGRVRHDAVTEALEAALNCANRNGKPSFCVAVSDRSISL